MKFKTALRLTLLLTLGIEFIIMRIPNIKPKIPEGLLGTFIELVILLTLFLIPPTMVLVLDKIGIYKNLEGYN